MPEDMVNIVPFLGIWEPVSSLMHLFAGGAVLIGAPRLVRMSATRPHWLSLMAFIFGASAVFLMSGTYHALPPGEGRELARRLDHAAIWMLIVGTSTPFVVVLFRGWFRRANLIGIWTLALAGVFLKTFFFDAIPEWVGLVFYIGFGWLGLTWMFSLKKALGWMGPGLVLGGGAFYTFGAVMEFARMPLLIPDVVGPHELFHVAIVLGVVSHWTALLLLMRWVESQEDDIPPDFELA